MHDFLVNLGGAERVLEVLCEMYPEAPIYTLLYDRKKTYGRFKHKKVHASFLQKFPKFLRERYKYLLPFMPTAPETFDLRDFDLVISSSGAWSKGIVTRLNTVHVSYLHSPMRFVWDASDEYLSQQKKTFGMNFCTRLLMNYIRVWDKLASDRPDYLISNSKYTQKRVEKYYRRESEVIYPPAYAEAATAGKPVDVAPRRDEATETNNQDTRNNNQTNYNPEYSGQNSKSQTNDGYFLVVSRLSAYKKVDVVVEAFNKIGLPLVIIGEGQQEKYLRSIAKGNVKILGWQSDEKIREYYSNARAFVFPCVDDFGIAPVEAMAQGVPVLAIRKGGALETVLESVTGEFFDAATPEIIADGVRRLMENEKKYDKQAIIDRAREFSKERFKRDMGEYIDNILKSKV